MSQRVGMDLKKFRRTALSLNFAISKIKSSLYVLFIDLIKGREHFRGLGQESTLYRTSGQGKLIKTEL